MSMTESEVVAALGALLEHAGAADRFSGAVLVGRVENGTSNVVFSGAYGLADREAKLANTLDTRFCIGSMNKMFTATSILQLVQAGNVSVTAPFGKFVT